MSDTLRPIHLALFFCERAISKHYSVYRSDHDDLVLWCMHRTAFFYYLCEGDEYLSTAESCENSFTDKDTSSEISPPSTILNTTNDGDRLLIEFLSRCWEIGGNSLYRIFLEYFLDFFQLIYDADNQTISVHMISDTFMLQGVDLEMIQNADNCFARFQMWISHSWKTMSFDGQMRLAAAVQSWFHHIRYLSEVLIDAPLLQGDVLSRTKLKKCINIRDLHVSLQNVFEGRSHNSNLFARFMFPSQGSFQGDNYATANVVNYFNENVLQSLRTEMSNGPQSVMNNIACGMLLYEKKYLQLRSLENALICAEGSVLIEHQFYSTTIIALSHLSCFEVHFSSCNATKAADCLAMGLQLIKQRRDSIEGYTISLFYLCAAQLLVISPGAAGSSLRSLLYTTHVTSDYLHNNSPGVIKKDATTIQSIPQTVLHALLESESDYICHPSPGSLWKDVLLSVMRNTVLVMGSLSGIVASPMSLTSASIQSLVDEVIHTSPFSVIHRSTESSLLIPELTRNTAHVVLAAQEGTLAVRKKPLEIIADYLIGIREVFGTGTLESVENDFFLRSVARYALGCWFAKYGYISAAYDLLDELVTEIYFSARIDLYTFTSRVVHPAPVNVDQAALLYVKSNSKMYSWSSDQLLCYAYVQIKRAELATFLGYTHYLPFQADILKHVSSSSQFAFGVLGSQFIEILHSQHTRHYNLAIEQACALHLSAEKIGYIFLAKRAMAQCVSALSKVGNHQKALFCLDTLRPISRFMHIWHTIARLNCCAELILNFDSTDRFLSSSFLLNLVSNVDFKFLFGSAMQVLDNLASEEAMFTTLQDAICLQASVQRILNNMAADGIKISVPPLCLEELLNVLHKRQYLRGSFSISPHLLDSILEAISGCCFFSC